MMKDKLQEILENATSNSAFYSLEASKYRNLNDFYSNFKLTKLAVVENMHDIISKKYDGNLYKVMQVNTTSGTGGVPVKIMWTQNDLMRSNLSVWRLRKKYYDISPHDFYCTLHTVSYLGSRINKIEKVVLTSESASFFRCATANMYGCMEVNCVAYECPCGTMHILEDNVAIETDEDKNAYLTSLNNTAFPLIKYDVGDKIELGRHHACRCGTTGMAVIKIIGRHSRQISLNNGNILNEAMIAYCIERAESIVGIGLRQYRAVYSNDVLCVNVICSNMNSRWRSAFVNEAVNQFIVLCDYDKIEFSFVDEIERTQNEQRTGKYSILEVG